MVPQGEDELGPPKGQPFRGRDLEEGRMKET